MPGEFDIIERYFAPLSKGEAGAFGLTDDAAVLEASAHDTVITTDTLVDDVHFVPGAPAETTAAKALRVNLSDLAAMGATPRAYTLSLTLGETHSEKWLQDFAAALARDQETYGVTLIGGDTVRAKELSVTITAIGEAPEKGVLRRSGAKSGDTVWVSGTIGDAALGLLHEKGETGKGGDISREQAEYLLARYREPQPRVSLGPRLVGIASACIDVSDGLVADLEHICRASQVTAEIEARRVPLSDAARAVLECSPDLMETVLTGGDDYELLFTAPADSEQTIRAVSEELGLTLTPIGEMGGKISGESGESPVRVLDPDGLPIALNQSGYRHF